MRSSTESDFLSGVCLPFLRQSQNQDGGWGFHRGSQSRVEPTAWALLALRAMESSNEIQQAGLRFLRSSQLPDGSWPSSPAQKQGCWVTSIASWALSKDPESGKSVKAALVWICQDWPKDIGFISRIVRKLTGRKRVVSQDDSLRGWGWTPETASWAEPTAFALIALDQAPVDLLPDGAKKRRELAKALLYDRMCVGGGWNCGNPMVYGVAGEPLAEPTAWALIALRSECQRSENPMSLEWLRKNISNVRGPGSLALARVCFQAYGYQWLDDYPDFIQLYNNNEFLGNVLVTTLMCLALTPAQGWLGSTFGSNNHANS